MCGDAQPTMVLALASALFIVALVFGPLALFTTWNWSRDVPSIVAAAIGGAASLAGAGITASAQSQASNQQAQSAQSALALQKQMFGTAQTALDPYITGSQGAEGTLNSLLTPGSSAQTLSQMPGFQFQSQWGTKTAQNALAAEGLGGSSGPLAKAISDYNNGLAGTYFQNETGALQNQINSGVSAGAALAGNSTMAGTSMANTTQNIGNAQASGTLGSANALASGLTSAGGSASNALILSSILGNQNAGGGIYSGIGSALNPNSIVGSNSMLGSGMNWGYSQ